MSLVGPRRARPLGVAVVAASVALGALVWTGPASASADDSAAPVAVGHVSGLSGSDQRSTEGSVGTGTRVSPESVIKADGRTQVSDTTTFPGSAIGQIELFQNGDLFTCTGFLVDQNTVLTSGHCAFDPDGLEGDPIESATFTAGRNGAVQPNASCPVYETFAPLRWRRDGAAKHDWAAMQLGEPDGPTCDVGLAAGWFGLTFGKPETLVGVTVSVQGYPGDKPFGTQWTASGAIRQANRLMAFYKVDTAAGQSGSPVFGLLGDRCGVTPCALAIHSYGVGLPGPGLDSNAGPRITKARFTRITAYASENG